MVEQDREDAVDVRRAEARFVTEETGRRTAHSFSFGSYYDPANLGFGPLICHNDDRIEPGEGYPDHPHSDTEIVTVVLDGALRHTDSSGASDLVAPGTVQVMSAGSGIRHSEMADAASGPTRFVQMWVKPDEAGTPPRHRIAEAPDLHGGLVPLVGAAGALPIGTRGAQLSAGLLLPGRVALPESRLQHVFVASGTARLPEGVALAGGDAVRLSGAGGIELTIDSPTTLLVWSFA